MSKKIRFFVLFFVSMFIGAIPSERFPSWKLFAAEGTAPQIPQDMKLELRDIQWRQAKTILKMNDLKEQYAALQKAFESDQSLFNEKLKEAESKAGIDLSKYDVNIDTLVTTEKAKQADQKK